MYKALIVGAGRIGAAYQWPEDPDYTHAGAYAALPSRVELAGFVEPDPKRRDAAEKKWRLLAYESLEEAPKADIYSVCTQPQDQEAVLGQLGHAKAIWCEKPFVSTHLDPVIRLRVQVNYLRRGDGFHRRVAAMAREGSVLYVTAKDDIHTRCYFEDLASWWKAKLVYTVIDGPNSYFLRWKKEGKYQEVFFSLGGVNGAGCMRAMLGNILDHLDGKNYLWSPA